MRAADRQRAYRDRQRGSPPREPADDPLNRARRKQRRREPLTDEEAARDVDNRYGLAFKEYFLFLGAIEPKKNISRLVEAYAASGSTRPLILVGGLGWLYEQDVEMLARTSEEYAQGTGGHFRIGLGSTPNSSRSRVRRSA